MRRNPDKNFLGIECFGSPPPHEYWWRSIWLGKFQLFLEQGWKHRPGVYRHKGGIWWTPPYIKVSFGKGFISYYPKGRDYVE